MDARARGIISRQKFITRLYRQRTTGLTCTSQRAALVPKTVRRRVECKNLLRGFQAETIEEERDRGWSLKSFWKPTVGKAGNRRR